MVIKKKKRKKKEKKKDVIKRVFKSIAQDLWDLLRTTPCQVFFKKC